MKKTASLVLVLAVILTFTVSVSAAELSSVRYLISGDASEIDTLQLEPEFSLNDRTDGLLNLAFDGDNFHFGAGAGINILEQEQLKMDMQMMVTDEVNNQDFGKAIGLTARTSSSDLNFYWSTYYFIDDQIDDHAYYRGGLEYKMGPNSYFDLSLGNKYWNLSDDVINFGIKIDI
ncbi:MAG: hypothetical protein ACOC17_03040 [Halanaerobium sp.]